MVRMLPPPPPCIITGPRIIWAIAGLVGFRQVSFPPAYSLPSINNLLQILPYCPFPSSPNNNDILESLR